MRKLFICLIILFLGLVTSTICCSQTETFDIATYTAPKDWKKDIKTGMVAYTHINTTTGGFCVLAMYASTASLGDAIKDFNEEWKNLAVTLHNAEANPKTETQVTGDGWRVITAAAPIKVNGLDAYEILTVFSGFQKKFSVMTTLNDQSYIPGIDALLKNIQLDKTANPIVNQTTIPDVINTNTSNGQFGTVMYTIPNGWKVTKYPDGDILTPADLPAGEFLEVWVQPSLNFSGSLEEALQKSYDETVNKMKAGRMSDVNGGSYSKQASKISFRGWEYIRCSGGIHLGGGEYPKEYGLDLFVIKMNGHFEKISIVKSRGNCSYSRYYPTDRLKYHNDIEKFLFTLKFADWKETAVKEGIASGEGITSAWEGISMSVGAGGAELKGKQLIFFSNGQAFFGNNFPAEGLDGLNTWVRAENNRRDWGTYVFNHGQGILKLPYAEIPLRMESGRLIINTNKTDHAFIKINSVDGARFKGMYALSSKTFSGEETGNTPLLTFSLDGKFTDAGALKVLMHEPVECLNAAKVPGSGVYEVRNYSVIFKYDDGRLIKLAFQGAEYDKNDPAPATLSMSFNQDILRKK